MKRRNPKAGTQIQRRPTQFRLGFGHILLILSGMLLMAVAQSVYSRTVRSHEPSASYAASLRPAAPGAVPRWGRLEFTPLALDRPGEYFTNGVPNEKASWVFRDVAASDILSLLGTLDLDPTSKAFLANTNNWEPLPGGFRVTPSPSVVIGLKPDARARLYEVLARAPENSSQRQPFLFRIDGFNEWFAACGLSPEKVQLVRQMTYKRAGALCFSDAATFSQLSSPEETMCLVKSLWRVPTFICSIRVTPQTDIKSLVDYWGVSGRAHEYQPFLESMARVGTGSDITISYFLPPFARLRLYTYPSHDDPRAAREDCFWTAMNFFNEKPDDRFFDANEIRRSLQEDYQRVATSDTRLGDVLLLVSTNSVALHMCVALADDVVFTKNGFDRAQPWVLMKLSEMLASYDMEKPFELTAYRRKALPGSANVAMRLK